MSYNVIILSYKSKWDKRDLFEKRRHSSSIIYMSLSQCLTILYQICHCHSNPQSFIIYVAATATNNHLSDMSLSKCLPIIYQIYHCHGVSQSVIRYAIVTMSHNHSSDKVVVTVSNNNLSNMSLLQCLTILYHICHFHSVSQSSIRYVTTFHKYLSNMSLSQWPTILY